MSWIVQRVLIDLWPSLSRAQRRAVTRELWPPAKRRRARAAANVVDGCLATVGGLTLDVAATDDARQLRAAEHAHMPFTTTFFNVCVYGAPGGGNTLANTIPWYSGRSGGPPDGNVIYPHFPDECFVRVYDGWRALSTTNRRTLLGHEMYHCLHAERGMRLKFFPKVFGPFPGDNPWWVEDGLATWAGNEVSPGTYTPESRAPGLYFSYWLDHYKQLPLFQQNYEPFGFWGLVGQEAGSNALWSRILSIWTAGADSNAVFDLGTGGERSLVLDHWGPGLFSRPAWPAGWQQQQPYAVTNPISVDAVVPVSGGVQVVTQRYAALKVQIDNTAQRLVEVAVDGHGRLTDGSARQWVDPQGVWLCLGGGCVCPAGEHEMTPIPKHTDTGPLVYAGLAADQFPTRLTLVGHDLAEYCGRTSPGGGGGSGGGGGGPAGGGSNGDPHLRTFDGTPYEFQALGEFVLARSSLGGFEVQARQQRVAHSFFSRFISINTQLAFRVGHARLTVSRGDPLVVRLAGRRIHPEQRLIPLSGGGVIKPAGTTEPCQGLDLRWPDGSLGCVWSVGTYGVAVWLSPAARERGHLVGLLGNFDGDAANDFRTRAGRQLASVLVAPSINRAQFNARYHVFGEAWRVRPRESLLDYGRHQTTSTFTDRSFPKGFFPVTRLPRRARSDAEAVCRRRQIVDPDIFDACVIDVGATGLDAFADSAAAEEQASAISTPWQVLAGLQHEISGPAAVAATPDGRLHIAIMAEPANDHSKPGTLVETSLDSADHQGPVTTDQPPVLLQYPPHLGAGAAGVRALDYVDQWPNGTPAQVSFRGLMSWQNGVVSDWLPGARGPATSYAETRDGTPYTVTVAVNNFNLWRGRGPTAILSLPPAPGPGCFDHSDQVASDGTQVWFAWLEINCADESQNGIYLAPVSTVTGAIGPVARVPRPSGATPADYDSSEPLAFVHRPGSPGAWLAYTLVVHGATHAFLLHTGDTTATDIGPVSSPRLRIAATASGRLWVGWFDNNTPHATWLMHLRRVGPGSARPELGVWTVSLPALANGAQAAPGAVRAAARGDRLDLIADFEGFPGTDGAVWHTRVG